MIKEQLLGNRIVEICNLQEKIIRKRFSFFYSFYLNLYNNIKKSILFKKID